LSIADAPKVKQMTISKFDAQNMLKSESKYINMSKHT
jgi:hypothetical protein